MTKNVMIRHYKSDKQNAFSPFSKKYNSRLHHGIVLLLLTIQHNSQIFNAFIPSKEVGEPAVGSL